METSPMENNALISMEMQPEYFETPLNDVDPHPTKRRKKKSIVWEYFTIVNMGGGIRRACCKNCNQLFAYSTGSKVAGTSHLKRHISKGGCPVALRNQDPLNPLNPSTPTGPMMDTPKRRYRTTTTAAATGTPPHYTAFDPDKCRQDMAQMIILHDYPLHIVEHTGFTAFVHNLNPGFEMVNFGTIQGDCIATYLKEKERIQKLIDGMPGQICLTLDLWNSHHTTGYVFVTGQFIDNDWKIHKKLLNVVMEPYPESDSAFSHAVATCLSDWNIEGKLFSVTINQPVSDSGINSLRNLLSEKNPNILNGQLLLTSCLARSLTFIALHAINACQETVKKVRDCVKYVKTSESLEEKFLALKQQLQVMSTKSLSLDDQTEWNTTYEMLVSASELKEVFSCLDTLDPDYNKSPTPKDWKVIDNLCVYLKLLFNTANLLTSSTIPTTNMFFHEAWKLQLELARALTSEDESITNLVKPIQEKFDKYWRDSCFVLAVAVVMDPRFKMKLVEFSFTKIYGDEAVEYIKIVDEGIHELFLKYVGLPMPRGEHVLGDVKREDGDDVAGLGLTDFDYYIMESTSQQTKSELDQYLEESLLPRIHEFDVMGWWKLNRSKYPTLSKMAHDILVVPVWSGGADVVFETGVKEMDAYRCSLRPETVEALFCAKDWIRLEGMESFGKMEFPI